MPERTGVQLTIAGQKVDVTHEEVPIDDVTLDPDNPRIRFLVVQRLGNRRPAPAELMDLIKDQPGYDGVHKDIRKAGGLYDPVIIRHDGLVVEGNSRTTVYKSLHAGNQTDVRWQTIPVARLPKEVSRQIVELLRASYHIAGKTVWRPFAQAEHIYYLANQLKASPEQIAQATRLSQRDVEHYLNAHSYLLKEVLPHAENGANEEILEKKFSHALEFVRRKDFAERREDPSVRKQLAEMIAKNEITGQGVRDFGKVLKSPEATATLKKQGFGAAKKKLRQTNPEETSKLLKDIQALSCKLGKMGNGDIELLQTSPRAQSILFELHKKIRAAAAIAKVNLDD